MKQSVGTGSAPASEPGLPAPKERRRLREAAALTYEDVAAALDVARGTVRSWESGRTDPRGRKRAAYAQFLARLAAAQPPDAAPTARAGRTGPPGAAEPAGTGVGAPGSTAEGGTESATEDATESAAEGGTASLRAIGAVRALAAGSSGRPVSPRNRPKAAAKRAAKSPVGMPRHEARTPAKAGAGVGGGAGGGVGSGSGGRGGLRPGADPAEQIPRTGDSDRPEAPPAPAPAEPAVEPRTGTAPAAEEANGTTQADGCARPDAAEPEAALTAEAGAAGTADAEAAGTGQAATGAGDEDGEDRAAAARETPPGQGAAEAFDALHAHAARVLARQAYLLTGSGTLAEEAVERAFSQAWARWPEVAVDPDPVGWVRAATYEYALSPWHRLRRSHRHPGKPPAEPDDRILLDAMLALPPAHRRTVLLYDGVGLDLPDTAAETEATTPTAGGRLLHAHAELAERIPELTDVPPEKQSAVLHARFAALRPAVRLEPRAPAAIRTGAERRTRRWTRATVGLTAVIAVATAYTAATAPTHYEPPPSPGANVSGVPPHSGPQRITEQSRQLHDKLRADPAAGPNRLTPLSG
ncbi:helix-turn-helix domain-containing protein [Streptomyces sp. NPDC058662]|uniref:helix-turn-helix domain-containing protein n=1 Tax=Streptomyces sp. NPDC058662 TaxID=3346583 RepID=UPI003666F317